MEKYNNFTAKKISVKLLIVILVLLLSGFSFWRTNENISIGSNSSKDQVFCIQVITKAKNPKTGEIRDFPTPCDVPDGWEKIMNEIVD